jgi:hypothetical protein
LRRFRVAGNGLSHGSNSVFNIELLGQHRNGSATQWAGNSSGQHWGCAFE